MRSLATSLVVIALMLVACSSNQRASDIDPADGLPAELLETFVSADSFEIVSLYPFTDYEVQDEWKDGRWTELVADYPVIGKASIQGAATRRRLLMSLDGRMRIASGAAGCYDPRHALRIRLNETWWEIAICFDCGHVFTYTNGSAAGIGSIVELGTPVTFGEVWTQYGLPVHSESYLDHEERMRERHRQDVDDE